MDALSTLTLADKYFRTARELSRLIVLSGNKSVVASKKSLSSAEYDRCTRRNDSNLGVPLLFNFYHGLELCLKGHLIGQNLNAKATGHKLSVLLRQVSTTQHNSLLLKEIGLWTPPKANTPIGNFLSANKITIDDWYQALKYPALMKGASISHLGLKYGGKSALAFWEALNKSTTQLMSLSATCACSSGYV